MPDKPRTEAEKALLRDSLRYIRRWLRYRKTTQRAVAEALEVSEPTVSKWLNGEQAMSVGQFMLLAKMLEAQPQDLLGPPDATARSGRLQKLAEAAIPLPDDKIDLLIASAQAMRPTQP